MVSPDFGILALEVYYPRYFVAQTDLEVADECVGKYTKGLGQEAIGVCSIEEDINSISMTVVTSLVRRLHLDLRKVGFLEVGSETLIDKSKSTKTVLMQLFEDCGNFDVEGVDVKNACFGGTAAFFHALNWLESSAWDGRLALVVAADIAVYGTKSARPTGGAGAVAILLGPDAPLIVDPGLRAHYTCHQYDFYKPDLSSEYPVVDGPCSVQCYRTALLSCYKGYKRKVATQKHQRLLNGSLKSNQMIDNADHKIDFLCFHTPFSRLIRKAFGWLAFVDMCDRFNCPVSVSACQNTQESTPCPNDPNQSPTPMFQLFDSAIFKDLESLASSCDAKSSSLITRDVESTCIQATTDLFNRTVEPGLLIAKHVGNMYTASLYTCLASLFLSVRKNDLAGKRVLMFSYGSGLAAAMFSIRVHPTRPFLPGVHSSSSLLSEAASHDNTELVQNLFGARRQLTVPEFNKLLEERREQHNSAPLKPVHRPDGLYSGTFFLDQIDETYRRTYKQMPFE